MQWRGRVTLDTVLQVLQSVGIIAGLYISYQALHTSVLSQKRDDARVSAETMLKFSELIDTGHDGKMMIAIRAGSPLLKSNGGKFETDDLDELLGDYQLLSEAYDAKVINDAMAYDAFSDDVDVTIHNSEVAADSNVLA